MKHNFLKSALLLMMATFSVNLMADTAVLSWNMGEDGAAATGANSITGASGCAAEGFTIAITGNTTKSWSQGNGNITIDAVTYTTLKNSNGAQNTVTLPEGMYASRVDFYVTTNANEGNGVLSEFNGAASSDVVSSVKNYTEPTHIIKKFTTGAHAFTFTFNTQQVCFIAVVTYSNSATIDVQQYTVSFVNDDVEAEGTVPAAVDVIEDLSIKIPANYTLYKEGYTLTGWSDGEDTYAIGADFTPTADVNLTPVFTPNTFNLLTATTEITVKWDFRQSAGAPAVTWQNGKGGFLVAHATLAEQKVDVKLSIATLTDPVGKFATQSDWCQVNNGTIFTFPSKSGATVTSNNYNEPSANRMDENIAPEVTGSTGNYVATFSTNPTENVSTLTNNANNYFRYIQVVYPASASGPTALDNTNSTIQTVKRIVNGQLLIERDGKTYTMQGQLIK